MGQISFLLPSDLPPAARLCLGSVGMAGGYDLTPTPARPDLTGRLLTLTRDVHESGYLACPWAVPGAGNPVILSATLRERAEPYHFLTELTRGKLNHIRTQAAEWQSAGLELAAGERAELADLVAGFGRAVLDTDVDAAAESAAAVLAAAHPFGDRLTRRFTDVLHRARVAEHGTPTTRVGARVSRPLGPAERAAYREAFNSVRVVPDWSRLEPAEARYRWEELDEVVDWAVGAGLDVSVGPLIDLGAGPFPPWLWHWEGDLPSLSAFVCDFVETVVSRYRGRVNVWQVFAGFNHADGLGLGEDERVRLAARLLEAAREAAPEATLTAGIAMAWGDYLRSDDLTYSPLVFADTLLRAGMPVARFDLELLVGDGPRTSLPRTVLDTYRLLDLFALLGLPLDLTLAAPTRAGGDETGGCPEWWVDGTLALALSVVQVQSVHWECWSEAGAARVTGCPLWTADAGALPRLARLREVVRAYTG